MNHPISNCYRQIMNGCSYANETFEQRVSETTSVLPPRLECFQSSGCITDPANPVQVCYQLFLPWHAGVQVPAVVMAPLALRTGGTQFIAPLYGAVAVAAVAAISTTPSLCVAATLVVLVYPTP
jgi:hypothetical protein